MERSASILAQNQISIRLDFTTIPYSAFSLEALHKAWQNHADLLRYNGEILQDRSVHVLDWARIEAFLGGIENLNENSLKALRGRTMVLNGAAIGLSMASPFKPEEIAAGFQLDANPPLFPGDIYCQPKMIAKTDEQRVLAEIVELKKDITMANALLDLCEFQLKEGGKDKGEVLDNLGRAKRMRFNAALAWQLKASALPNHPIELTQATDAVNSYAVPVNYIHQPAGA